MATKAENKSMEVLLNRFHELSQNTKELDSTVSNFSQLANDFKVTLEELDHTHSFNEIEKLSKEAVTRLKELKSLNELQVLDKLKDIIQKEVAGQNQKLEGQLKKIITQTQSTTKTSNTTDNETKLLLQQINSKLDRGPSVSSSSNEELLKLKRMVTSMSSKIKKMEDEYEQRITLLEIEIELLRGKQSDDTTIDISDEDLPF